MMSGAYGGLGGGGAGGGGGAAPPPGAAPAAPSAVPAAPSAAAPGDLSRLIQAYVPEHRDCILKLVVSMNNR